MMRRHVLTTLAIFNRNHIIIITAIIRIIIIIIQYM